jgi:hypothetical protein
MFRKASLFVALLVFVPLIGACSSSTTATVTATQTITTTLNSTITSTSTSTATVTAITIAPTPTATGTPATKAGDLANFGANLYDANCTFTYCHAKFGDPTASGSLMGIPANVEFSKSAVSFFGNGDKMFVFMKSFMHHPDTASFLTDDQLVQIEAYLLTQNGDVAASAPFGLANLDTINLPAS